MKKIMVTQAIKKRFKILALLCLEIGCLDSIIQELGDRLDEGHPQSLKALSFYEDKIIEILETNKS